MDGRTDTARCRVACPRLKSLCLVYQLVITIKSCKYKHSFIEIGIIKSPFVGLLVLVPILQIQFFSWVGESA